VFDPIRSLFDVRPEVDIQRCCRPVVVVQTRRRCSGALSLFVVVVLLFAVRSCLVFSCLVVLFDYSELPGQSCTMCTVRELRWQLNASPLFIRFLMGVASVSSAGASVERGGACPFAVPWETGSNRSSGRRWAALDGSDRWKSNCGVVVCFSLGSVALVGCIFSEFDLVS